MKKTLQDITKGSSKYRYLLRFSTLLGDSLGNTRATKDSKSILIHEAVHKLLDNEIDTDYLDVERLSPIDSLNSVKFQVDSLGYNPFFTHISIYRTLDINNKANNKITTPNTFIWCNDVTIQLFVFIEYLSYDDVKKRWKIKITGKNIPDNVNNVVFYGNSGQSTPPFMLKVFDSEGKTDNHVIAYTKLWHANMSWQYYTGDFNIAISSAYIVSRDRSYLRMRFINPFSSSKYIVINKENSLDYCILKTLEYPLTINQNIEGLYYIISTNHDFEFNETDFVQIREYKNGKITVFDNISDDILRSRLQTGNSLYILQNRFFEPIPSGNTACAKGGALFCGKYKDSEYHYTQLSTLYRAGFYNPFTQKHTILHGVLTRLKEYPDGVVIFGETFTLIVNTSQYLNSGDSTFGEFTVTFNPARLVNKEIGMKVGGGHCTFSHGEIVVTNETAIRFFDGYRYGDNLVQGNINILFEQLKNKTILHHNIVNGIILWGNLR
jgi:hypothetical protein